MASTPVKSYKQEHDFEKRKKESARIREKYPDRVPVIVEKAGKSDIPNIDKKKFLIPRELTLGQLTYVIRKRIDLGAEKAIFLFIDNILPTAGALMSTLYEEEKDEDGFLYVTYSGENTFGFQTLPWNFLASASDYIISVYSALDVWDYLILSFQLILYCFVNNII